MQEWLIYSAFFMMACFFTLLVVVAVFVLIQNKKKKPSGNVFKVKVYFETSKIKLTLNAEQYEQLLAILNEKEGVFDIGDEYDMVRIYREKICLVKVKIK